MLKERFFEDLTPVETEMVREYVLHELCHGLEGTANAENLNDSVKECPRCGSEDIVKYGFNGKTQRFACKCCGRTFSSTTGTMFFSSSTDFETWSSFIDCEIKGLPLDEEAYKVFVTEREIDPFSWMRFIVLSNEDWERPHEPILAHEIAHIRHKHSFELLLVDTLTAFQWFNPAIWMLRMDLQEIHEYEADDAVLRSGTNIKEYQYLLVRKAVDKSGYSVANSFNHSTLKNRITMMKKNKTPLKRGFRVLLLIPLMSMCVGLQTQTVYDDLPVRKEGTVELNLQVDGLVYMNGSGYGLEVERVGRYVRGAIGNRVYPPLNIEVLVSPEAPAGASDQLMRELRNFGLLDSTL